MSNLSLYRTPTDMFARFDEMANKLFSEAFGQDLEIKFGGYPRLDLYDDLKELVIEASVPGLTKDDVSVEWSNGILTIYGESSSDKSRDVKNYKHKELHRSRFSRSMRLDEFKYDVENIDASVKEGLLTVRVPRRDISKDEIKKINVK